MTETVNLEEIKCKLIEKLTPSGWATKLRGFIQSSDFDKILEALYQQREAGKRFTPPVKSLFTALEKCPLDTVKVVIIGQDPYHGAGQAHGLCFSVEKDTKIPPTLRNIYKELNSDVDISIPTTGNLQSWADQGVLMLNATLTVRANEAGSHQKKGWETFTDAVIQQISKEKNKLIQDMLVAKNGGAKTQKPVRKKAVEFHCETLD